MRENTSISLEWIRIKFTKIDIPTLAPQTITKKRHKNQLMDIPPVDIIPDKKTNKSIITSKDNKKDKKWLRIKYIFNKIKIKIKIDEIFIESTIKNHIKDIDINTKIILKKFELK